MPKHFFMIFKKVCKLKQDALSMYQSFGKTLKTMFWFFRLISCNEEKITGWALKFSIHTLERIPILTLSCSVKQWYQIIIVALYKYVVFPIWLNLSAWNVVKRILINKYFPLDWTVLNLNGSNFTCGCMTDLFIQYVTDRDLFPSYHIMGHKERFTKIDILLSVKIIVS